MHQACKVWARKHERPIRAEWWAGEYCHLAAGTTIIPLGEALPDEVACPANCATATVAAAFRTAGVYRNRNVAIFGAGALGLTAAMAKVGQAASIILCDIDAERLKVAERFGADHRIRIEHETDVPRLIQALTHAAWSRHQSRFFRSSFGDAASDSIFADEESRCSSEQFSILRQSR